MSNRTEGLKAHVLAWARDWLCPDISTRGGHVGKGFRLPAWLLKPRSFLWIFSDHPANRQVLWFCLSQNQTTLPNNAEFLACCHVLKARTVPGTHQVFLQRNKHRKGVCLSMCFMHAGDYGATRVHQSLKNLQVTVSYPAWVLGRMKPRSLEDQ